MPADHKVSVAWQIVFTFLPIVNFWAFYRIRKLTKYIVYVIVPSIVISTALYAYLLFTTVPPFDPQLGPRASLVVESSELVGFWVYVALNVVSFALQGLAIYLVIIWSRLHNRRVDASMGQAPSS